MDDEEAAEVAERFAKAVALDLESGEFFPSKQEMLDKWLEWTEREMTRDQFESLQHMVESRQIENVGVVEGETKEFRYVPENQRYELFHGDKRIRRKSQWSHRQPKSRDVIIKGQKVRQWYNPATGKILTSRKVKTRKKRK